jgi:hypothetical protein
MVFRVVKPLRDRREAGLNSRERGRLECSCRALSLVQEYKLREITEGGNQNQMKLPFALWNRRALIQLVEQLYGIQMLIRTVGEYLRRWGYDVQRSVKRALEQEPEHARRWLLESYSGIVAREPRPEEGVQIYWADETVVAEDGHWVRGYAPSARTPVLEALVKRYGLSMVSAINNRGLACFQFIEGA